MKHSALVEKLGLRTVTASIENITDNSKANSGGDRDVNFLRYLLDNKLLELNQLFLKRSDSGINEEYYLERYKKFSYESDRHFLCRTAVQDELKKIGFETHSGIEAGNMNILRANSNYDIAVLDFSVLIDIGLTPARNYFRGLTDLKVSEFMISSYFDDYIDEVVFAVFSRVNDDDFLSAVRDYEEGYKLYTPDSAEPDDGVMFYNRPSLQN